MAPMHDFLDQLFDEAREGFAPAFSRLQDDGAETLLVGEVGRLQHFVGAHRIAWHGTVPADAAIMAVLGADIGKFDEPAQIDLVSQMAYLGLVRRFPQGGGFLSAQ